MTVSELEGMLRGMPGDAIVGGLDMEYDAEKRAVSYRLTAFKDDNILRQCVMESLDLFIEFCEIANCSEPLMRKVINQKTL